MMHAATPAEVGEWLRWYHLPVFLGLMAQMLFVDCYLGTSGKLLMWAVILARGVVLGLNFVLHPNFNFSSIDRLHNTMLLGEEVSAIAVAQPRVELQWFAVVSLFLLMAYILDAAVRRWRTAAPDSRRKALAVLLAIGLPMLCTVLYTQPLVYGVISGPISNIPWFLGALLMMAYETGREFILSRRARLELANLRNQMQRIERTNLLGQLSSALAHELSQPLTAISANVRVARTQLKDERPDIGELPAILDDIALDNGRAVEIIERMRLLFKHHAIALQPIKIEDVIRDAVSLVLAEANSKQVVVHPIVQPTLPRVFGDRVHLSQVLLNLIMNGIQAVQSRPTGARLIVVEARADSVTGEVEIAVQDSGPGIPDAIVDQVFDPLFTTKPDGMGMGLALSRRIIEAHGGRLWVDRHSPRGGAVFRFILRPA
jgi:signal transduction histidine kinase